MRHRDMDTQHQDEEAFREELRRESHKAEKARTRQMMSVDRPLAPKHQPTLVAWLVIADGGVVIIIAANLQSRFLLAAGRGGTTVALPPNPLVSSPIAGLWRHLPSRRQSRRGSSVSDYPKWRTSSVRCILAPLQFG